MKKLKKKKVKFVKKIDKKLLFPAGGGTPAKGIYQMLMLVMENQYALIEQVDELVDTVNELIKNK